MNPDGQMKLSDSVKLIGLCNDMCPEFERVRRIVQNDFKRPECVRTINPSRQRRYLRVRRHRKQNISHTTPESHTSRVW